MIAKGNLHGDGGGLAGYLLTGERDEIAQLVEVRGLEGFGSDPVQAFATLQKVAEANTQSSKPFFHVQTRNPDGDKKLTDDQWLQIADREEKRLGLVGQPRIVSFHIEDGEKHMHVAWFRIDLETMRAIDSGLYKNHLKQLCRSLEKEYGLQEVSNFRKPEDKARAADRKEVEEARRLGMDDRAIRATILDCLQRTDGGKAFRAALDERGMMLANGDKRDCFVVIDQAGGHHALNKKLTGLPLAALRDRLGDLDRAALPTVEQAKAEQHEKYPTKEQAREAWEAKMSEGRTTGDGAARDAPQPEPVKPRENWHSRDATKMEERIFHIQDAAERGGASVAATLHAEGITIARVDATSKAQLDRDLRQQFGNISDERFRGAAFREGELVAVTKSDGVHRLNPRFIDLDKLERAATNYITPTLSDAQRYFADRSPQHEARNSPDQGNRDGGKAETIRTPHAAAKPRAEPFVGKPRNDKGLKVNVKGVAVSLSSFVESLFGMGAAPHAPDQQQHAPQGGRGDAYEAMEEIYERSQRGLDLSPESIRHLPAAHLENLRAHGDAYMHTLIRDFERERERDYDRDYGRERER